VPCLAQAVDIFEGSNGGEAQRIVPEGTGVQPMATLLGAMDQNTQGPSSNIKLPSIQKPTKNQQKEKLFQLYQRKLGSNTSELRMTFT
jgi:hypothetical protein